MGNFISRPVVGAAVASCMVIGGFGIFQYFNEKVDKKIKPVMSEQQLAENPVQRVIQILEDLRVEFTPVLIHWFNVYNKLLEESRSQIKDPEKALAFIQQKIDIDIKSTQEDVCKKHGIDHDKLWPIISYYQYDNRQEMTSNRKVQELQNVILGALKDVISGKRPDLKLVIPQSLTKAMYIKVYNRLLFTLRHHHYMKIREKINEKGGEIDKNQLKEIGNLKFSQQIRGKVFNFYKIQKNQNEDYHRTLKKAFYSYYEDKEFQSQIDVIQKHNHKVLGQIVNGQIIEGMQSDPFEVGDQQITGQIKAPARNAMSQIMEFLSQNSRLGVQEKQHEAQKVEEDQNGVKNQPKIKSLDEDGDDDDDYEDVDIEDNNNKSDQPKDGEEDYLISSQHDDMPRRQDYESEDKNRIPANQDAFQEEQKVDSLVRKENCEEEEQVVENNNIVKDVDDDDSNQKKIQGKEEEQQKLQQNESSERKVTVEEEPIAQENKKHHGIQDAFEQPKQDAFEQEDAFQTKDESKQESPSIPPPPAPAPSHSEPSDNKKEQNHQSYPKDPQEKLEEKNNNAPQDDQNDQLEKDAFDS